VVKIDAARPPVEVPRSPSGLLAQTRQAWTAYWNSDVARVADEVDLPAIRRLFTLYDEHQRALNAVRKSGERIVTGSRGQLRMNPIFGHLSRLEVAIGHLEGQFGLTPASRARLGLVLGRMRMTAAELNAMTERAAREEPMDEETTALLAEFEDADEETPHE
jgi:P27 family predicted phage terminase small subunit